MTLNKIFVHASLAQAACIVLSIALVGCSRETPLEEVYTLENNGFMRDPEFKKSLEKQERERKDIIANRERLIVAFNELKARAGSEEAARKLPEWKALEASAQRCGRSFESNRWVTADLYRARMERARKDTERVKRGEAKAKQISK